MLNSLKSKLTVPVVGILFAVVLMVVFYSSNIANDLAHDLIWERAEASLRAAAAYIAQMEQQTNIVADAVARDYEILVALQAWNARYNRAYNRTLIINRLRELVVTFGVDSFTVRDLDGRTIVRLHDLYFYYDIDGLANAINAIQYRETTISFTSTAAMPMSLICTVPIIHQDEVQGTIAPIFHFNTKTLVNHLSAIFGTPVSIYRGYERLITTLPAYLKPEKTQANEAVAYMVLNRGQSYMIDHYINKNGMISYYTPFLGAEGHPIGMMAVHFSTAEADAAAQDMIITMVIIGFSGIIIAAVTMVLIIAYRLKPLDGLARSVKTVAEGGLDVIIDAENAPNDEIGTMTRDVHALVTVVKTLVEDMETFSHMSIVEGDIEYRIDANKYKGSFNEVITSLNNVSNTFIQDFVDMLGTISDINNGNLSVKMRSLPGQKRLMNQTIDAIITNLSAAYDEKLKSAIYANQLQLIQESIEKTRAFKHDTKHHFHTLKEYAKHNKTKDIQHYLSRLIDDIDRTEIYSNTGNLAFDSIINYKLRNAEGVKPQLYIHIPTHMEIEAADIAVIIGNLLDNALEALKKTDEKSLMLDIEFSKGILFITVKNSFNGKITLKNTLPISTKNGEHGYGLKNVKKAVEKYNGHMEITHENKMFSVMVLLYESS